MATALAGLTVSVDALDRRLDGRPSWTYTTILSLSTALNGALGAGLLAVLSFRK